MLRVRAVWTGVAGTPWYTNLYFDGSGSVDAQAAAENVHTFLSGAAFQFQNGIRIDVEAFVAVVDPVSGDVTGGFTVDPGDTIAGQLVDEVLPPATQSLTTFKTPVYVGGRNIQGKCFLGGYTEAGNSSPGVFRDSYRASLVEAWNDLLATGPDLVVWSRKNGQFAPVSSVIVQSKWAVLRSRRD